MLTELRVRDLGVIADLTLVLEPGMTALTGETGAGKTLVVEAIELLVGGRADAMLVRPGAKEAVVEGRFENREGEEIVLARVIPTSGRSRAYVDGRMAPISALAEAGSELVDLHGQHAHQSLLSAAVQRGALDVFGEVDVDGLTRARRRVAELDAALADLGGDSRARAREIDLLRFQLDEIDAAGVRDPDEDAALSDEEDRLADAVAHREAAAVAHSAVTGEGGAIDTVGATLAAVQGRAPFAAVEQRLRSTAAELADLGDELRGLEETIADDPQRLAAIRERRQQLRELQRKYGDTLADVIAYSDEAHRRLRELESYEERAAQLEADRATALTTVRRAEAAVGKARRAAAPELAAEIEAHLHDLALPRAAFTIEVGDEDPGDDVVFNFGANPGEPALPLARVASGGELARAMLATRLVLMGLGPGTLVFDEVDAGIGGEAAATVGRALAALAVDRQVLVVTHLPQVAAFADHQVAVSKEEREGRTIASATLLDDTDRVVELSRMLSGQPGSSTAREHAEELLGGAADERGRVRR